MIHTLKCPSCGAPLDYDDREESSSVRCPFCNTTAVLRERTRRGQTHITLSLGDAARHATAFGKYLAVVVLAAVVLTFGLIFYFVRSATNSREEQAAKRAEEVSRTIEDARRRMADAFKTAQAPGEKREAPGFASIALKFGSEGIGPGSFTDARHVAVDGEGRIYAADYMGGRVQVFDAAGKFITQWMVDAKMPLRGLAAHRNGTVYIVQRGKIQRYEGASGKFLGELSYSGGNNFDDVTVAADGGLVAAWHRHSDDIVRFDAAGKVVKVLRSAISTQTDRSELSMRVAVDGLGNIYALGTFNDAIFKFTPEGRYVTRFGSAGNEPGQFRALHTVAVDGRGRVYVSDSKGIQVFDADGRYLNVFKSVPVAFGMVFNDRNELFVAARTQIVKLTLNQ